MMPEGCQQVSVSMTSRQTAFYADRYHESEADVYRFPPPAALMFGPCFLSLVPVSEDPEHVAAVRCDTHETDILPFFVTPIEYHTSGDVLARLITAVWDNSHYPAALAWEAITHHVAYHWPPARDAITATRTMWALGAYAGQSSPWYVLSHRQRYDPNNARHCATPAREPVFRVIPHTVREPRIMLDVQPGQATY